MYVIRVYMRVAVYVIIIIIIGPDIAINELMGCKAIFNQLPVCLYARAYTSIGEISRVFLTYPGQRLAM